MNKTSEATENQKDAAPKINAEGPLKVDEMDRLRASEALYKVLATQNAFAALKIEAQRLAAEQKVVELQTQVKVAEGQELETALQVLLDELRDKYGVPAGCQIDTKTGLFQAPDTQ